MGTELPATTQLVVTVSDTAAEHPILFLGGIFLFFGGIITLARAPRLQRFNNALVLKLPVIGTIVREVNSARTTRTLSSLLMAGVDVTRALSITREVVQNLYFKDIIERASAAVQKGEPLSAVFKAETKYYPVMVGEMIAVGEETGKVTNMLADVANFYEAEVDAKTKNLSTIIEPVLMLFIGGAVGFFAISMITPMYSLLEHI